ncbi:MAG: hypothetical protein V1711_00585, partial [bacterium]
LGNPSRRQHESVVDAVVEALTERGANLHEIAMCMHFAIPAAVFEHHFDGLYGPYNHAIWRFVDERWPSSTVRKNGGMLLDLEGLFEEQARQIGVMNVWSENSLAELPALTHTRDGKKNPIGPSGREVQRRNLIVVKRCCA